MSESREPLGVPHGFSRSRQPEGGQSQGRRRHIRTPGMPEEERRARRERQRRFRSLRNEDERQEKKEDERAGMTESSAPQETVKDEFEPKLTEAEAALGRKPWETVVIGDDLGENLSNIEAKNREIAQWRYIIEYQKHENPHQAAHSQGLLEEMIRERAAMPDNEENNLPEDQREKPKRIEERLNLLKWALETSECEDEAVNIRAAIEGYRSKEIPYSDNYTLIYAGHIVDSCRTYRSFCVDRQERLDSYFARFGPGWLWHEPPLGGTGELPMAMKGVCLPRKCGERNFNIGYYEISMRLTVDKSLVTRGPKPYNEATDKRLTECEFRTLLDSGATFPLFPTVDLRKLEVDLRWHPAQGVTNLTTVGSTQGFRFFEMTVSARDNGGGPIIGDNPSWPNEKKILGGLNPVCLNPDKSITNPGPGSRLSGMVPFDACYMSSAPTMKALWIGEDRRDVLGASRMPAHKRYDTEKEFQVDVKDDLLEKIRARAPTPTQVVFTHHLKSEKQLSFNDVDVPERGLSQLSVTEDIPQGPGQPPRRERKRTVVIGPRHGEYKSVPRGTTNNPVAPKDPRSVWRKFFLTPQQFMNPSYKDIQDRA